MDYQKIFQQARNAAANGDFHTSREYYSQLWNSPVWHNDRDVKLSYAYACERTGDYSEALTAYKSLIANYASGAENDEDTIAEESMVRLQELMAGNEPDTKGHVIDRERDESESQLIARLFEHGYPRELSAGEQICQKGESAGHMWLLKRGDIDVIIPGQKISTLSGSSERPCLIGELAYFTGMRRAATLTSATTVEITELPYERVRALLKQNRDLSSMMEHLFRHRLVLQVLSRHEIFKLFNDIDRRRVTTIFENTTTNAGLTLIEEGKEYPDAFMVQSGTLLLLHQKDGEERLIGSMQPGDLFHLGGLLRGYMTPYSVVSGTPCHLLRLPRHSFEPFMLQRSWLIKAILKHSRLSAEQQVLHPEARNLWAADRYFDMKQGR
ncbi:MAG: cyclic nucleotide-binding domain-containing protein [Mariprofundaceae bacterium]|nr:cyclic nucleotide-binding domain-containing protein [Mariprofundaceae bacterium]